MASSSTPKPIRRIILSMPAYNEAASIGELLDRGVKALAAEELPYNILVVDDGSQDATAAIVQEAGRANPVIKLVKHPQNRGLGPAILTGLASALELIGDERDATLLVCMDADLTHPPELIPEMRRVMESGADMVIASRFQPGSEVVGLSAFRHLMSWGARNLFSAALAISGVRDYTCGFRAFRLSLIARGFERYGPEGLILRRGFACTDELLIKLSLLNPVIKEIPFILRYDLKRGKSKIKLGVTIMETLRLVRWARAQLRARRARTPD